MKAALRALVPHRRPSLALSPRDRPRLLNRFEPEQAYATAKFAVKGFSEALINDLRHYAPHVNVSVVMPGHIGTPIGVHTRKAQGQAAALEMSDAAVADARANMRRRGAVADELTDQQVREAMHRGSISFEDDATTSTADAARIILDGVRDERWRILVGEDAVLVDRLVRDAAEEAYEESFIARLREEVPWKLG